MKEEEERREKQNVGKGRKGRSKVEERGRKKQQQ